LSITEGNTLLEWAAIQSVANKLGMTPETLRHWVRQTEIGTGDREGITSEAKCVFLRNVQPALTEIYHPLEGARPTV